MVDDRKGDWNGQLARFVVAVSEDCIAKRVLDPLEEEALELVVRARFGIGPLRRPSVGTLPEWLTVLERLRELGYLEGAGAWYTPTLAGFRRGLLLITDGEALPDVSQASALPARSGPPRSCTMLTRHSGPDPAPDVACGGRATFVHRSDRQHFCCAVCYAMMADDVQLASEYVAYFPEGS